MLSYTCKGITIMSKENIEKEIENIESMVLKRYFLDNNGSKIDILARNYLDSYEYNKYNELKIELACLINSYM